jgi:hypothetical protein
LRLRVECSLFCNIQSQARTHAVLIQDSRFIWKHSDTYTYVARGHFLNNIYIQDMTELTYDAKFEGLLSICNAELYKRLSIFIRKAAVLLWLYVTACIML